MCDPTQFNPVCPACSRKVAVNNGDPVVVDRETKIDGVLYSKIVRKPVRCRDKSCMQRFIVSKLSEPVTLKLEVPPHEWMADLMERPSE